MASCEAPHEDPSIVEALLNAGDVDINAQDKVSSPPDQSRDLYQTVV